MKLLILDTETTGLPRKMVSALTQAENWPHIVSISWIVMESDTNKVLEKKTYIIKPNGWIIPQESINIHGITQDFAEKYGADLGDIMKGFLEIDYDMMIAHNLNFDENVIVNAIRWDTNRPDFTGFQKLKGCTMNLGRNICKLPFTYTTPFKRGYKSPKLSELYEYVFHEKPDTSSLHGSAYDTKILCECIVASPELRQALGLVPATALNTNEGNKGSATTLYL
jgi:DNA polymerase III epsilon subunit-like protein